MKKNRIPYLRRGNASLRVYLMRLSVSVCGAIVLLLCAVLQLYDASVPGLLRNAFIRRGFFCLLPVPFASGAQRFQPEFAALGGFLILLQHVAY